MQKIINYLLSIPRLVKGSLVFGIDVCCCILATWIAYCLRLDSFVTFSEVVFLAAAVSIGLATPIFTISGFYRTIFRYSGTKALVIIVNAILIYWLLYATIFTVYGVVGVPRSVGFIQPILLMLLIVFSRTSIKFFFANHLIDHNLYVRKSRVLIYGAGVSGRQLENAMRSAREVDVVGFLDDNHNLHGHLVNGVKVYAPNNLIDIVSELKITDVLLAMPSCSRRRRNEIIEEIRQAHVAVRTLPHLSDLAQGKVSLSDLRELDINDLLGREPIEANYALMAKNINAKVVLVTGAGGSIGSELCRQILAMFPKTLLLVDQNEYSLYSIHQELEAKCPNDINLEIVPLLGSVMDVSRVEDIITAWRPDAIYHAAAYKHVPLVEHNPVQGIKNNVFGTLSMAELSLKHQVSNFVLVSTDKAVRPTNVMGASKRLAEVILQALSESSSETCFSIVRFGNVLGSSGSVVPKFWEQIHNGGPVTVTHPEVTRYFMTIPEAAQLVIQAGAMAKGGEVFLLDMGDPIKIIDLAKRMVELSGLSLKDANNSTGEIDIVISGLRPGEKLFEELLIDNNSVSTQHPRIMKANEAFTSWSNLEDGLLRLKKSLSANDSAGACAILRELVREYSPSEKNVDWIHLHKSITNMA